MTSGGARSTRNQKLSADKFEGLRGHVATYLGEQQELFTQDLYAGADPAHRVRVRLVTSSAWHALFARNMFIRPPHEDLAGFEPDYVILHAPHYQAEPSRDGVRTSTAIALSFARKLIVIAGTEYAGEIKKSIFTVMNWKLPAEGVLPMHCSANMNDQEEVALFFGLSGTGKTTLSSDPARPLIGDDEHGWGENGIFNFEGGCYAKVIDLSRKAEPVIWDATHRFGTVLENVQANAAGQLDLTDSRATPNTRACYPIDFVANASSTGKGGQPKHVVMLTCDAFGVFAADCQALRRAGDVPFPVGLHGACGWHREGAGRRAAGHVLHLLRRPVPAASARGVWQDAGRPDRALRCGLLAGEHRLVGRRLWRRPADAHPAHAQSAECGIGRDTGEGAVPQGSGVRPDGPDRRLRHPDEVLNPREAWSDKAEYDRTAHHLAALFEKNFATFQDVASEDVKNNAIRVAA